jgi:hypothetical protein
VTSPHAFAEPFRPFHHGSQPPLRGGIIVAAELGDVHAVVEDVIEAIAVARDRAFFSRFTPILSGY